MGARFSDVIEAAIRAARTRPTAQSPRPAHALGDDMASLDVEAEEETATGASSGDPADGPPAAATDVVVPPPGDALAMDRST